MQVRDVTLEGVFPKWRGVIPDFATLQRACGSAVQARYLKVRERTSYAFAVVSAAAWIDAEIADACDDC